MKICILTSAYPDQGGPSGNCGPWWFLGFIKELEKRGHEVFVITTRYAGHNLGKKNKVYSYDSGLGDRQLAEIELKSIKKIFLISRFLLRGLFFYLKTVSKEKPDFVLACWAVPFGPFALAGRYLLGIKYSVFSLGSDVWNIKRYPFGLFVLKSVYRNAVSNFANSFKLKKRVEQISKKKCFFAPVIRTLDFSQSYSIKKPENRTIFLYISRYSHDKGPDILLKSLNKVIKKRSDIYLYMFGSGTMKEELKQYIKDNNLSSFVKLGGFAGEKDIASYLKIARCVVIPSRADSVPVVFSESVQAGCPMIVSEVGDLGLLIRKYKIGYVFQRGDDRDLAGKLLKFLKNKNRDYSKGLKKAKKDLDVKKAADIFLSKTAL